MKCVYLLLTIKGFWNCKAILFIHCLFICSKCSPLFRLPLIPFKIIHPVVKGVNSWISILSYCRVVHSCSVIWQASTIECSHWCFYVNTFAGLTTVLMLYCFLKKKLKVKEFNSHDNSACLNERANISLKQYLWHIHLTFTL